MFGYLAVHHKSLSKEDAIRYQMFYCGLCRSLSSRYGAIGRRTLSYDMTFLALLLSALYPQALHSSALRPSALHPSALRPSALHPSALCPSALHPNSEWQNEQLLEKRCILRPFSRGLYVAGPVVDYAADMNILLRYHQQQDDWKDDRNRKALRRSRRLQPAYQEARVRRPRQAQAIETCLSELARMEAANELNADKPANCFGVLLGEVFIMTTDAAAETSLTDALRQTGAALGRFIYLLDAANDLHADIKKERYNPLVAMDRADIRPTLYMLMGECTALFEKLPIKAHGSILRNILYAGVWTRTRKPGADKST